MNAPVVAQGSSVWRLTRALRRTIAIVVGVLFAAVLFGGLGVLPFVQFIPLGYLLHMQRRIARRGEAPVATVDEVQFDLDDWARFGRKIVCWGLILVPLATLHWVVARGEILEPASRWYGLLHRAMPLLWVAACLHLTIAELRGGGMNCLNPVGGLRWLVRLSRDEQRVALRTCGARVADVLRRGVNLFLFGARGFIAVGAWLWPSALFLYFGGQWTWCEVTSGVLLGLAAPLALLAGVRFAVEDRMTAAWQVGQLVRHVARAPWSVALALLITCVLTLPLYVLTYEMPAWDTAWALGALAFLLIWPARAVAAWAYRRSAHGAPGRWPKLRNALGVVAVLLLSSGYATQMFYVQGWTWQGARSYFDQHAFMLPNLH
jgi:hypothetical protein